ncbi:MAG: hypothetical protein GC186_18780 [Rhodobacteraceae bacterium]|nr:hypothetical protein [Paracoccaceae bacterium]
MKRDKRLQLAVSRKLEAADTQALLFEEFYENPNSGCEEIRVENWTKEERYNIALMVRDGTLRVERVTDAPWRDLPEPGATYAETYIYLTSAGHDALEASNWFQSALKNVITNIPTIGVSLFLVLAGAWLKSLFGLK